MPKVILLTGPPSSTSFHDSPINQFEPAFHDFIQDDTKQTQASCESQSSIIAWRSLPLQKKPLRSNVLTTAAESFITDNSNDSLVASSTDNVITGAGQEEPEEEDDQGLLSEFCEQSISLTQFDYTGLDETSFITASNTSLPPLPPAIPAHLSDLEDIPSASQVASLHPQTITLNIIAGIISISQPRNVTTRWGQSLSLVELLVGDDTRCSFAVTFWLAAGSASQSEIGRLQRQDVILLQNVALHVFRGKVYGQSLRRDLTKIHLLWRRQGGGHYTMGHLKQYAARQPQVSKTKRVVDWIIQFVGLQSNSTSKRLHHVWDRPPDDTQ